MGLWLTEILFWSVFLALNSLNFVINYIFYARESDFFPILRDFRVGNNLGLTESQNCDMFRFVAEFSLILLLSRIVDLSSFHALITGLYFLLLIFNIYQYAMRRTYHTEPVLFNDLKLLKNGISIVWHESPFKVLIFAALLIGFVISLDYFIQMMLVNNIQQELTWFYMVAASIWMIIMFRSILNMKGTYPLYPGDIYMRIHFTAVELWINLKRSREHLQLSRQEFGSRYRKARKEISLTLNGTRPNVFFLFIESYGAYYFKEPALRKASLETYQNFDSQLAKHGYYSNSIYSTSTAFGGQSWLAYSSVLYGYEMNNNTLFENHLNDPIFRQSNSLLHLFRNMGYKNYNLNPITPIVGINVPYDEMREFYAIDRWILNEDINYNGDEYGWGACAPDQYSMNFMMDLIKKEEPGPFTYFYLTKNSHSPFITPKFEQDWKSLNNQSEQEHIHRGFLANPEQADYANAIQYEFDVIQDFITRHGSDQDIFLLIGDHQPPFLSDEKIHGRESPVHIFSKNEAFINEFSHYGFQKDLDQLETNVRHESLYSIFLNVFAKNYAHSYENLPDYETEGIQL
ncbi:MAG: sulfatase-like hydrolase/transferase [Cytophagales bacterium]|nr:sulfatase-like hydrolase/transferase [Cytophagales bacterium]